LVTVKDKSLTRTEVETAPLKPLSVIFLLIRKTRLGSGGMTVESQVSNLSQGAGKLSGSANCVAVAAVALKTGCDAVERRRNLPTFARRFCLSFCGNE
jgi:hypothetical protein